MSSCDTGTSDQVLTEAEMREIEVHKYYLSCERGHDVGLEFATFDWLTNHAREWRERQLVAELNAQLKEIQKHKWIESEKAGRDLGREAAFDWITRFASEWRRTRGE